MNEYLTTTGPYFIVLIFVCIAWWFDTKTQRRLYLTQKAVYEKLIKDTERRLRITRKERDLAFEYIPEVSHQGIREQALRNV